MIELNSELLNKLYLRAGVYNQRKLAGIVFFVGSELFCFAENLPYIKAIAHLYLGYSE